LQGLKKREKYKEIESTKKVHYFTAKKAEKQVYGNLHGFRIVGCRLQLENEQLKMTPGGSYWPALER